ncbi:MAG: carbamoyl-phosphate synthase small subunit [Gaiellaceae bacterium]|jgi:carbamoyl-phosphate synthase small subunit|nr:carbamoyl-phosphate synthase small subunit [Gaiellaceae bacterium]
MTTAHLVLEDGTVFAGRSVGAPGVASGEACFTTAMAGYEQAASDPSYVGQVLCFSYPLVGNYGVDPALLECDGVQPRGIVMRRARPAWARWLAEHDVIALDDVDTRALVRRIREGGPIRCALGTAAPEELHARAQAEPPIDGRPLAESVGTLAPYAVGVGPRVVLLDLGCKRSIVERLARSGLRVTVVPGSWTAEQVLAARPRLVVVGNGPGDPAALDGAVETVRQLLGAVPVAGICLGHQLLGLALGLETFKLPFGHRGANHPVRDTATGRVLVTSQNHGYALAAPDDLTTHVSLNDGTCEGIAGDGFFAVQFHPEAAPGPLDALPFFDRIAETCRSAQTFKAS